MQLDNNIKKLTIQKIKWLTMTDDTIKDLSVKIDALGNRLEIAIEKLESIVLLLSNISIALNAISDKGFDLLKFILKGAFIVGLIAMGAKSASEFILK